MSVRRSVLVVDDSPTAVMYLSLLLRRMGFRVVSARNGLEALRVVRQDCPDAVLLDLHMPEMDGLSFLSELRKDGAFRETPVIAVTVDTDPAIREKCLELGCSAYLQKPVDLKELHAQIETCMQRADSKRDHLRAAFGKPVSVAASGRVCEYHAVTLSEGGIYLRMGEPFPSGTTVTVTLPVDGGQALTLQGEVLYDKGVQDAEMSIDPGVAIAFSNLTPQQSFHLTTIVKRLLVANLFQEIGAPILDLDEK
jgi:CheY-like chemotaxis protein